MRRLGPVLPVMVLAAAMVVGGCANKWKTSGKIAMGSKNYEKALSDFNKALEENPKDGEVHYLIAVCYKDRGDYAAMIPHLNAADSLYEKGGNKVKELRESAWRELFDAGNSDTQNENYEKARDEFSAGVKILPDNYGAYANLGYVWQKLGDKDSAYYYFSEAYRLEPENIKVIENLAGISFNTERYAQADSLYARVIEKDPKNAEAMVRRGIIAADKEDFQTATDFYNAALGIEPRNCDLWFNLGVMYFQKMKKNEDALNAFQKAVELCPNDVNAQINLNVVLIMMKRFDEAAANLETFTQDYPDECVGWDLYSQALLQKGMRNQALDAAKKYDECKGESK